MSHSANYNQIPITDVPILADDNVDLDVDEGCVIDMDTGDRLELEQVRIKPIYSYFCEFVRFVRFFFKRLSVLVFCFKCVCIHLIWQFTALYLYIIIISNFWRSAVWYVEVTYFLSSFRPGGLLMDQLLWRYLMALLIQLLDLWSLSKRKTRACALECLMMETEQTIVRCSIDNKTHQNWENASLGWQNMVRVCSGSENH